jgi:hypothetical protein
MQHGLVDWRADVVRRVALAAHRLDQAISPTRWVFIGDISRGLRGGRLWRLDYRVADREKLLDCGLDLSYAFYVTTIPGEHTVKAESGVRG